MRRASLLLLALALVGGVVPELSAHPVAHAGPPRIRNLRPMFGEVVGAGDVAIAAQVLADVAITSWELKVDGVDVPAQRDGTDPSHAAIVASPPPTLAAGDHIVELRVTGGDGRTAARAWRFTASNLPVRRLAGSSRVETAAEISRDGFPAGLAPAAVLARADDFADALAGAALAEEVGGPVLLTSPDELSEATRDELQRVTVPMAIVYVLGGPGAISEAVTDEVQGMARRVERVAGDDRYGTARAIAEQLPASDQVFIVNGTTFADALGASSPSAAEGIPVLLTTGDHLAPTTRQYLRDHSPAKAIIVGGDAAVAPAVATEVDEVAGAVERVSGADRYATAAAVAARFFNAGGPVGLASGETFPDALAGGRRMGALGGPLLLTPSRQLASENTVGATEPGRILVFGGPTAVSDAAVNDLRRVAGDTDGPVLAEVDPAPGVELNSLTSFSFAFNRPIELASSTVYVSVAGEEVGGTLEAGDFASELVFTATEIPLKPTLGASYDVRVLAIAFDGTTWRHIDNRMVLRKRDLARGDTGAEVLELQQRLTSLGYWLGTADGSFGTLTTQAVLAFQKVNGLTRDGVANAATRAALETAGRPAARSAGDHIEVDKTRQVLFIVRGGAVAYALNTSTGTERPYTFEGSTYIAHTPNGTFTISREIDGERESRLGKLWRPKYFTSDGVAVHGSSSVPAYPASHGCVRLTVAAMDWVWANNLMPIGTKVLVYQ